MSAWIVSKEHIDVLVKALGEREIAVGDPSSIGAKLWHENHLSVNYQYDEEELTPSYLYEDQGAVPLSWILKNAQCYAYQTCEHPGWTSSEAFRWIDALSAGLESQGVTRGEPGNDVPWGIDADDLASLRVSS